MAVGRRTSGMRLRTYVATRETRGFIAITRVDAPRIDAAMAIVLGHSVAASRLEYLGNGVHKYVENRDPVSTYYVADVEAMQAKA